MALIGHFRSSDNEFYYTVKADLVIIIWWFYDDGFIADSGH
jgi:hypothetical protein